MQAAPDVSSQYISFMNAIFAAQVLAYWCKAQHFVTKVSPKMTPDQGNSARDSSCPLRDLRLSRLKSGCRQSSGLPMCKAIVHLQIDRVSAGSSDTIAP